MAVRSSPEDYFGVEPTHVNTTYVPPLNSTPTYPPKKNNDLIIIAFFALLGFFAFLASRRGCD